MQTEEGHAQDAVETYLQVLALQNDSDEVANAHVLASIIHVLISLRYLLSCCSPASVILEQLIV